MKYGSLGKNIYILKVEVLDKKTRRPHSALLGSPAAWPSWDASSVVLPLCCILSLHHYSVVASSLNQPSCDDVKTPARGHKIDNTIHKGKTCAVLSIQYNEKTGIWYKNTRKKRHLPKTKQKTGVAVGTHAAYRRTKKPDLCEGPSLYCMHQSSIYNFSKKQAASGTTRRLFWALQLLPCPRKMPRIRFPLSYLTNIMENIVEGSVTP